MAVGCQLCRWELFPVLGDERSYCARPGPMVPRPCEEERESADPAACGLLARHFATLRQTTGQAAASGPNTEEP
jgi:hypothetical protein